MFSAGIEVTSVFVAISLFLCQAQRCVHDQVVTPCLGQGLGMDNYLWLRQKVRTCLWKMSLCSALCRWGGGRGEGEEEEEEEEEEEDEDEDEEEEEEEDDDEDEEDE